MTSFKVEIQEFLSRIIEIDANSLSEAISQVRSLYQNEEIILGSENFVTFEIKELSE